jgi:ribosomal protein S18 acetylase RimI-like enzyme
MSSHDDFDVRFAREDELVECGKVAAKAFVGNPSYDYIFKHLPSPAEREAANAWLLARRFWICMQTGGRVCCAVQKSTGRIVATMGFGQVGKMPSLWLRVRAGWLLLPLWFGMEAISNIQKIVSGAESRSFTLFSDSAAATLHDRPPLALTDLMAVTVDPAFHKSGIGSRMLTFALEQLLIVFPATDMIVMDTQQDYAARWYVKVGGFEIKDESILLADEPQWAFRNWVMAKRITKAVQ